MNTINLKQILGTKKPEIIELPKGFILRNETCEKHQINLVEKIGYTSKRPDRKTKHMSRDIVEKWTSTSVHCPKCKEDLPVEEYPRTPMGILSNYGKASRSGVVCMFLVKDFDISFFETNIKNTLLSGTILYAYADSLRKQVEYQSKIIYKIKDGYSKRDGWTKEKRPNKIDEMWDECVAIHCTDLNDLFSAPEKWKIPLDYLKLPEGLSSLPPSFN